ncbi:hypothetical protein ASG97_22765 [Bacillus sp. Soil745]|nr:hypothetical protein ASG97_22765 [Bacillus sp. Soil745]
MNYEYRVMTYNNMAIGETDESLALELNYFGRDGWELVSAMPIVKGDGSEGEMDIRTRELKFVFKRQK